MGALLLILLFAQVHLTVPPDVPFDTGKSISDARITKWAGLLSVHIPYSCAHPRLMPSRPTEGLQQKRTCQMFLRFPPNIPRLRLSQYRLRTWDEEGEEDSSFRIFLNFPNTHGIYVRGVCGHRIFVEVTYR